MLTKIAIRNVGVLRAFNTPSAPKLDRLTLFYGRNGRGKSTLTSVLRAARDGEAATVLGRQSLGNAGAAPKVALVSTAGNITFENGAWSTKGVSVEVFDTTFITDNVYAGELIDLAHDRGLFSVIIGTDGVRLAKHLERFNVIARSCAIVLKEAEASLSDDVPSDMSTEHFCALSPNPDFAKRLDDAERELKTVRQADKISKLKQLVALTMPELPGGLSAILASTVADIDASARGRLLEHFKRFSFDKMGQAWISYGVEHIHEDTCPLCGRDDVDAEGMVTLYGQIFGETYKAHLETVATASTELEGSLGEGTRAGLANEIALNAKAAAEWAEYVTLSQELPDISEVGAQIADAHRGIKALLDRKRSSPLDVIEAVDELAVVSRSVGSARELIRSYNAAVEVINDATRTALVAASTTEAAATLARNDVKKRVARQDPGVQKRVNEFRAAKKRDQRARAVRTQVQKRLKKANENAAAYYHERVNHYLGRFSASFTISEITNSMQGNAGQADYGLLIKGETISRGRGRQVDAMPSFRNTLSAGDKTTLALAFFLAKLDNDPLLDRKTVVVDDPLSSHDSHRRRETVNAIKDLCTRCLQVIVLSHDEFLLREVQRRCVGVPCSAFQIDFNGGDEWSSATAVDLDQLCRAGHRRMVEEIVAYVDHRQGDADEIVLKGRQVLETHYRRSFIAYFDHDRNLGQIVRDISDEGASHPCYRDLGKLDNCNDATCDKHHGDDAIVVVKRGVDPDGLRVVAADALELIGARKPALGAASPSRPSPAVTSFAAT